MFYNGSLGSGRQDHKVPYNVEELRCIQYTATQHVAH